MFHVSSILLSVGFFKLNDCCSSVGVNDTNNKLATVDLRLERRVSFL